MHLEKLDIHGVRNLSKISLDCHSEVNVIEGKNAAGKTSILESIHILSKIVSFRTSRISDVIRHGKESLIITAKINDDKSTFFTGVEKGKNQTQIKYKGKKVFRRSEQARNIPVFIVTTESHGLLYGTPRERRHWLDWSLFHVEPDYIRIWHDYYHALRQRNVLLRTTKQSNEFTVWESILAKNAVTLRGFRCNYLKNIKNALSMISTVKQSDIKIELSSNQANKEDISEILKKQRGSDISLGYTQYGSHREDVKFQFNGRTANSTLSRGESKLFVMHLLVAQAEEYKKRNEHSPILLIDDLAAELDEEARSKILQTLNQHKHQLFITTTQKELLGLSNGSCRVFHVEHGEIVKMLE